MAEKKNTQIYPYNADGTVNKGIEIFPNTRESAMKEDDGSTQYHPAKLLFSGTLQVYRDSGISQSGIQWDDIKNYRLVTVTFSDGADHDQSFMQFTVDVGSILNYIEGATVPVAASSDLSSAWRGYMITVYKKDGWWTFHMKDGNDTWAVLYLKRITGVK